MCIHIKINGKLKHEDSTGIGKQMLLFHSLTIGQAPDKPFNVILRRNAMKCSCMVVFVLSKIAKTISVKELTLLVTENVQHTHLNLKAVLRHFLIFIIYCDIIL